MGIGLTELGIGLIELGIGLIELGIGLMELGKGLKINNARRTVLARVSGLVFFTMAEVHSCQDLSNFHIVIWWSKLGATEDARELISYTDRCPQRKCPQRFKK